MKYFLIILFSCSLIREPHLDYHFISSHSYHYNIRKPINDTNYWHITDSLVIRNNQSFIIESLQEIKPGVYSIWTPSAYFELDINDKQLSTYSRKQVLTLFTTYNKLEFYELR